MDDAAAPVGERRSRTGIAIAIALVCTPLVAVVGGAVSAVIGFFVPSESAAFDVTAGVCRVDPGSGDALLQLSMATPYGGGFGVEPPASKDITLEGVAVLPAGQSIAGMQDDGLVQIAYRTYRSGSDAEMDPSESNVVLRLARHGDASQLKLDGLVLSWGFEIPHVQHVPLHLVWSGSSCSVDLQNG